MKEIKQKRRLLAAALTVVMTLGSLPLTGIAAASSGEKGVMGELICGYIVDEDDIATESNGVHRHTEECYLLKCPTSLRGGGTTLIMSVRCARS